MYRRLEGHDAQSVTDVYRVAHRMHTSGSDSDRIRAHRMHTSGSDSDRIRARRMMVAAVVQAETLGISEADLIARAGV